MKAVLEGKRGEGYIDTAVKMIIAGVIGALLLGGLYYIFNTLILPGLAERIQGTGLGLAIVKHICAIYGADLSIDSTFGEGTTFTVVFKKQA